MSENQNMKTFRQFKEECMQDPEFAKEYEEMEEEFEAIRVSLENPIVDSLEVAEEPSKTKKRKIEY